MRSAELLPAVSKQLVSNAVGSNHNLVRASSKRIWMQARSDLSQSPLSFPVQQTLSLPFHTTNLLIVTTSLCFNHVPAFCVTEVSGAKRHTWLLRVVREWQGTGEVRPGVIHGGGVVYFRLPTLTNCCYKRFHDCQMSQKANGCDLPSDANLALAGNNQNNFTPRVSNIKRMREKLFMLHLLPL
jgi:hypothetical protein